NNAALGRIDDRIDNAINDLHRRLAEENATLLRQLGGRDMAGVKQTMARTDELRDEFHARIESIRADMLAQVAAAAKNVMTAQTAQSSSQRSSPPPPPCSASCSR